MKVEGFSLTGEEMPEEAPEPQFSEDEAMVALAWLDPLQGAVTHPSWVVIARHLEDMHDRDIEELIDAPTHERAVAAQARVKLLRELMDLPDWVDTEIARYREALETGGRT